MAGPSRDVGVPLYLSASGTVKNAAGILIGFFVNTLSASPTLDLYDTATAGATPSGQPHFLQGFVLTAGWQTLPASFANGLQAVITGTAGITFIYQ